MCAKAAPRSDTSCLEQLVLTGIGRPALTTIGGRWAPREQEHAYPPNKNRIIMRSLGTKSASEAARLFPAANAALEAEFTRNRQSTGEWPTQPPARVAILQDLITKVTAKASADTRRSFSLRLAFNGCGYDPAFEADSVTAERIVGGMPKPFKAKLVSDQAGQVQETLGPRLIPIAVGNEMKELLETKLPGFLRTWCSSVLPRDAGKRKFSPPPVVYDPEITLGGLRDIWIENRQPKEQTVAEANKVLADFKEAFGDIAAKDITSADLLYFKEQLLGVPKNLSNREARLSLAERVACAEIKTENGSTSKRPRVSEQTVAKKLSLLKAILGAKGRNNQPILQHNPAIGFGTGHEWKGDQLTPSKAAAFFGLPVFTEPTSWRCDRTVSHMTLAWLGLQGLVSAGRLGEIAQLHLADVIIDGANVALDITEYLPDGTEAAKSLKTESSRRVIVFQNASLVLGFSPTSMLSGRQVTSCCFRT